LDVTLRAVGERRGDVARLIAFTVIVIATLALLYMLIAADW
jgi:hypothetical protein